MAGSFCAKKLTGYEVFFGVSVLADLLSFAHSLLPFLSLQQAFVQCAPFLQQAFSCAKAPPDNITAATNNNVSFFIVPVFCKD